MESSSTPTPPTDPRPRRAALRVREFRHAAALLTTLLTAILNVGCGSRGSATTPGSDAAAVAFDERSLRVLWPVDRLEVHGPIDLLVAGASRRSAILLIDRGPYLRGFPIERIDAPYERLDLPTRRRLRLKPGWHRIVVQGCGSDGRLTDAGVERLVLISRAGPPLGTAVDSRRRFESRFSPRGSR